jgi:flagellar biosynthesis/type III secretory pathway protein FliH
MNENHNYIKSLQNEIDKLERKLKVTEADRDLSKYIMGILVANCVKVLEKDDIDEIKEQIKETIHKCAEYTKEHM